MSLLTDLQEFVHDHRPHDGMTADATEPKPNGYRLTVACACGVVFERWVGPQEADADLIRWAARNYVLPTYEPMAPTQVREPFHRDGWIYEEKVDGWRIIAYKDGSLVRLMSRNGRDHTRRFAHLAAAISKLPARSLVLDGEVAIFDQQFRSRFEWLRHPDPDAVATPPMFIVFDLLDRDGRDLTRGPLRDRRARLEDVIVSSDLVLPVRLASNGLEAWQQVIAQGYEGLVAKDPASTYEGGPTRRWLKVKQKGWTVARGSVAGADQGLTTPHPSGIASRGGR